jgi:thiamine-phosphate pyrophosphorylase
MSDLRAERAAKLEKVDLYPVTGQMHSAGRSTEQIVQAILSAGCGMYQVREKDMSKRALFELAVRLRVITPPDVLMFINDHLDVALAVGADGVHLGQDDLPLEQARKLAPDLLLGGSSHCLEEAQAAQEAGADYVNIGPIYATDTKEGISEFLGPEAISSIAPKLHIPFTVMGGIKLENLDPVLAAGARRIAVVTAVTAAEDPEAAARQFRQQILGFGV